MNKIQELKNKLKLLKAEKNVIEVSIECTKVELVREEAMKSYNKHSTRK